MLFYFVILDYKLEILFYFVILD